ncbi:putative dehydrogenase [Mycobacterium xenopi 3993]|nr:putative dehydrogenase [Mycobacterium xenopi 3993]
MRFHTGVSVTAVEPGPRFVVRCEGESDMAADGVVLSADVRGLRQIVCNSMGLGTEDWRRRIAALRTAPPFVVQRLWLDRPVRAERAAFLGTGGRPPLDNVSVLERYEHQAAQWAARTGGSVVELHSYAVTSPLDGLGSQLLADCTSCTRRPRPRDPSANGCCAPTTAHDLPRRFRLAPGVVTPHPGLALAGDGIRIDLPVALMERAATTGWAAANHLLAHFGLAGHTLQTVPIAGRSTVLRWLAQKAGRRR